MSSMGDYTVSQQERCESGQIGRVEGHPESRQLDDVLRDGHRAFDGAYVAAFMDHLRTIIETRDWETEIA